MTSKVDRQAAERERARRLRWELKRQRTKAREQRTRPKKRDAKTELVVIERIEP